MMGFPAAIALSVGLALMFLTYGIATKIAQKAKHREMWNAEANRLSLEFDGKKVQGGVGQLQVSAHSETRGSRSTYPVTVFRASLSGAPAGLQIRLESAGTELMKGLLLTSERTIGNLEFDEMFFINGPDDEQVRAWLSDKRRSVIMEIIKTYSEFRIEDGGVYAMSPTGLSRSGELSGALEEFASLAGQLSGLTGERSASTGQTPSEIDLELSPIERALREGPVTEEDADSRR